MTISIDEYKKIVHKSTKKHKYNASPSTVDCKRFPSKLESEYYKKLKLLQSNRQIAYFLCQIPFTLPAGVRYFVDFMIVHNSGNIDYIDTKGHDTPISILKRKQVESLYPVKITIVSKI